jgi:hypothetical protein
MNIVLSLVFAGVAVFGIVLTVRAVRSHGVVDTAAPENDSASG